MLYIYLFIQIEHRRFLQKIKDKRFEKLDQTSFWKFGAIVNFGRRIGPGGSFERFAQTKHEQSLA